MATPVGDSLVIGAALGAGSWVLRMIGVEPDTVFVAVAACFLGAPFARPVGPVRAVAVFCASVVVTCNAASAAAVSVGLLWPVAAAHERTVQAVAAIVVGVLLHIAVSHAPELMRAGARRLARRLDQDKT